MRTTLTRTEPAALDLLGGDPDAPALVTPAATVDYGELADRVAARRAELGTGRRLVFLSGSNTVETVVTYLAALAGGHPLLFVAPDGAGDASLDALAGRYAPDVVVTARGGGDRAEVEVRHSGDGRRHEFHPDLALLASTSGSTGSPKLVRLSRDNVVANARSIAEYLRLTPADRAATTLPVQYCYGLSVVNSHLVAGGSLLLTDRSVVEPAFWSEFDEHRATSIAGVPYTYELLESTDFDRRSHPTLRYMTQAGGRLAPERVRRLARLGRERGFDVVVMYGQTEATARMAYLPPELAETAAGAIGVPIPGGAFRIDEGAGGAGPGEGELVYSGPNVMMGYAESPADLARGPELAELRTGDLARRRADGLYEITGRLNRFVKAFGLRLDLDRIERGLADAGIDARAVGVDERLAVFVREERGVERARQSVARITGLPAHAFDVRTVAEFPRTPNGKPDHAALRAHAALLRSTDAADAPSGATSADELRDVYAEMLGRPDATPDDSFASLDGDSLNYVELALQLESRVGALPADWPSRRIRDLAEPVATAPGTADASADAGAAAPARTPRPRSGSAPAPHRRRVARVETSVVLRALAIVLIVATHADVVQLQGGAHLLLAVAGFNLARFRLTPGRSATDAAPGRARAARALRVRGLLRSVRAIAVPAVLWVGGVALIARTYDPATVALSNWLLGSDEAWSDQRHLWFIEALVWAVLAIAAIVAVPGLDALERRRPYAFAAVVLVVALAIRSAASGGTAATSPLHYELPGVAWLIALGWLVARSTSVRRRLVASAVVLATVPGFFGDPLREAVVVAGLGLLVWATSLPVPAVLAGGIGTVASASMFVYLTHWQVYPPIEEVSPPLAIAASFAVGIAAWWAWTRLGGRLSARRPRRSRSAA
ncbi:MULTISPECIES: AMP-binding protein [unclassified Agromyces]|uniref:AMP-binding protein n=1 Tax=unclassified Agromyces TaxID=2639701 RepID=UPI003014F6A1